MDPADVVAGSHPSSGNAHRAGARCSALKEAAAAGRYSVIAVSGAAIVAVLLIVATGNSGFIHTV